MAKFKLVSSQVDFPALERELLDYWYKQGIVEKYLKRNENSDQKFSFLDGPITANSPMGVHHGWGRTYKDLWERFFNMHGYKQRFQNGFDEQGLWVEVNVEKDLELHSKKDIENLVPGDNFKSLEKFVNLCKERVKKYSGIQTEQSKRLGYFMDWENSYHTSSDKNNYTIWNFLKIVHEKGWLYKGRDSVPWCPRCGTAISQHEILTEEYKEITHDAVFIEYPILGRDNEYLIAWTTTPWTLIANVSLTINPDYDYVMATGDEKGNKYYLLKEAAEKLNLKIIKIIKGRELVGLKYSSPFDSLPRVKISLENYTHAVFATDDLILPISKEEGTGIVHTATGAGGEDFKLGKKYNLPVIEVIGEEADYLDGLGEFSQQNAKKHPELIIDYLRGFEGGKYLFYTEKYTHRYPTCWRCKTELVWRVVDEWYIAMDISDDSGKTYRGQMMETAKKINWIPKWGIDRELDWLKNMHDWLISKKRYWGLALPIWECKKCNEFIVIGSKEELQEKAAEGFKEFEGHSPHRPWVDQIKIKCPKCTELIARIPDVGNPWLDAGIVPFSTMPEEWFPADFVTEGFPGQFKNWFYSLIAMSTALKRKNPFKNLLGFANVVDEKGEEMHKSKGNSIEFNEAADKIGVDVMRWMFATANPENNLNFGYSVADEIRRRFYLILWNSYKFFIDYANVNNWDDNGKPADSSVLDRWILSKLNDVVLIVNEKLRQFDAQTPSRTLEDFIVNDFSTWYIRRSRDRVSPEADSKDRNAALFTMHEVLLTLSKVLTPFLPFISETIYKNLTDKESVNFEYYPKGDASLIDKELTKDMIIVRKIAEMAHAKRKEEEIKLRQPLAKIIYKLDKKLFKELENVLKDELNVKNVEYKKSSSSEPKIELDINITQELKDEGEIRELIRQVQSLRKEKGLTLNNKIKLTVISLPKSVKLKEMVLKQTNASEINTGEKLDIEVI